MADQPVTPDDMEHVRAIDDFADTMFCKMAITLLFGELARLQGSDERAREFLKSQNNQLSNLVKSLAGSDDFYDTNFRARFEENITVVFNSISIGHDKK